MPRGLCLWSEVHLTRRTAVVKAEDNAQGVLRNGECSAPAGHPLKDTTGISVRKLNDTCFLFPHKKARTLQT